MSVVKLNVLSLPALSLPPEGRGGTEGGGDAEGAALLGQPLPAAGLTDPEGTGRGGYPGAPPPTMLLQLLAASLLGALLSFRVGTAQGLVGVRGPT